jgi:hypothetical protein
MMPGMANKCQERDHLAQSDRHIAEVKQSIKKQFELVDELKRAGRDATKAEELLDTLIQMLRAMLDHRLVILKRITPRPWGQITLLDLHGRRRRSPQRSSSGRNRMRPRRDFQPRSKPPQSRRRNLGSIAPKIVLNISKRSIIGVRGRGSSSANKDPIVRS